jgi:DNA polymerase elongation subunit (family B)
LRIDIKDYIKYIDTDSLFIAVEDFLLTQGVDKAKWDLIPDDNKIDFVKRISRVVENHVDKEAYEKTQIGTYNSSVTKDDFAIQFKQEIVCRTALFIKKKMYGYNVVDEEGEACDKIDVTGLVIIRSECPTLFRSALKHLLEMILKGRSDDDIRHQVDEYKEGMESASAEDVAENKGINNIDKYIKDGKCMKKTPYHVKGANNYHFLLKELGIQDDYERIRAGDKAKIIYVKKNRYGVEVVSFYDWPKEFTEAGIQIDYGKQMEKFFVGKVKFLLEPQNREMILTQSKTFEVFF